MKQGQLFDYDIIRRLDAAIVQLQQVPEAAAGLARLIEKRRLAASGEEMVLRQVNEEAIALIGREIAVWTRNTQTFRARPLPHTGQPAAEGQRLTK